VSRKNGPGRPLGAPTKSHSLTKYRPRRRRRRVCCSFNGLAKKTNIHRLVAKEKWLAKKTNIHRLVAKKKEKKSVLLEYWRNLRQSICAVLADFCLLWKGKGKEIFGENKSA
jgi:hypothetical protein